MVITLVSNSKFLLISSLIGRIPQCIGEDIACLICAYVVIEPEMPKEPMFIRAVLPSQEDFQETEKEDNPIDGNSREELDMDTSLGTLQEESTTEECPYLKPPKRTKLQQ